MFLYLRQSFTSMVERHHLNFDAKAVSAKPTKGPNGGETVAENIDHVIGEIVHIDDEELVAAVPFHWPDALDALEESPAEQILLVTVAEVIPCQNAVIALLVKKRNQGRYRSESSIVTLAF